MAAIGISKATKRYGAVTAVDGIDLSVDDGEFVVLLGPSGCGKSTLLRMVAGLEEMTSGEIRFDGTVVNDVPTQKRNVAMVFQNYALYPHMSVAENLSFGLKVRHAVRAAIGAKIGEAARILGIEPYLARKPRQLSGGQRQRVAMGRSIVREPVAFLFDEPLSNLDAKLRAQMRVEIRTLQRSLGATALYVTHDQVEAMTLADRVVVLNRGRIEQVAAPLDLYQRPATLFVADFIGTTPMNFIRGAADSGAMRLGDTAIPLPAGIADGAPVTLGIRPEHLSLERDGPLEVRTTLVEPLGSDTLVYGTLAGQDVVLRVNPGLPVRAGETVRAALRADHVHLFDAAGTRMN